MLRGSFILFLLFEGINVGTNFGQHKEREIVLCLGLKMFDKETGTLSSFFFK